MKSIILSLFLLTVVACTREPASPPTPTAAAPSAQSLPSGLSRVTDVKEVCMVTDQFMGSPQIPVEVEGRTYYGCCAMCKERLNKEPAVRTARDPVSGEEVDKARAVIVQDASGKLLYFASEDTLRQYRG
jgi:YHS domain-containing protein